MLNNDVLNLIFCEAKNWKCMYVCKQWNNIILSNAKKCLDCDKIIQIYGIELWLTINNKNYHTIVKYSDFISEKLTIMSKNITYNGGPFVIRTPIFNLIPHIAAVDWYDEIPDVKTVNFIDINNIKFPFDSDQPNCIKLQNIFSLIDGKLNEINDSLLVEECPIEIDEIIHYPIIKYSRRFTRKQHKIMEELELTIPSNHKYWGAKLITNTTKNEIITPIYITINNNTTKVIPNNIGHLSELIPYGSSITLDILLDGINIFPAHYHEHAYEIDIKILKIECILNK